MNCIIIDDEPFALDLIRGYVQKTPFLTLSEAFTNPFKALEYLNEVAIDLIFLDINMPELSGIQLLRSLTSPPLVIFTTAYPEFGAESYEYNAVDYLLKPFKYERFLKAAYKAFGINEKPGRLSVNPKPISEPDSEEKEHVFIKSGTRTHKVKIDEISYVEGAGNYTSFYVKGKKILTLLKMSDVTTLLPDKDFVRIHKSFIISINKIDVIESHQVIIEGKQIPIGVTYREVFSKRFR